MAEPLSRSALRKLKEALQGMTNRSGAVSVSKKEIADHW
jgi:hypothetical protein